MAQENQDLQNLHSLARLRVLLVEDNEIDRKVALAMLNQLGLSAVQTAETGPLAMGKIENAIEVKKPFDLILLDSKLPGHDGISVLRWLRYQPKSKATAVIMITATSNASDVAEFATVGISGYVVKPLTVDVLQKKLLEVATAIGLDKSSPRAD